MTAEELLTRAADRVEKGWTRGMMIEGTPEIPSAFCTLAAITFDLSSWHSPEKDQAICAVAKEISGKEVNSLWGRATIIGWNDCMAQSSEEVATTLRNAKRHL